MDGQAVPCGADSSSTSGTGIESPPDGVLEAILTWLPGIDALKLALVSRSMAQRMACMTGLLRGMWRQRLGLASPMATTCGVQGGSQESPLSACLAHTRLAHALARHRLRMISHQPPWAWVQKAASGHNARSFTDVTAAVGLRLMPGQLFLLSLGCCIGEMHGVFSYQVQHSPHSRRPCSLMLLVCLGQQVVAKLVFRHPPPRPNWQGLHAMQGPGSDAGPIQVEEVLVLNSIAAACCTQTQQPSGAAAAACVPSAAPSLGHQPVLGPWDSGLSHEAGALQLMGGQQLAEAAGDASWAAILRLLSDAAHLNSRRLRLLSMFSVMEAEQARGLLATPLALLRKAGMQVLDLAGLVPPLTNIPAPSVHLPAQAGALQPASSCAACIQLEQEAHSALAASGSGTSSSSNVSQDEGAAVPRHWDEADGDPSAGGRVRQPCWPDGDESELGLRAQLECSSSPTQRSELLRCIVGALPVSHPGVQLLLIPAVMPRGKRAARKLPGRSGSSCQASSRAAAPRLLDLTVPLLSEVRDVASRLPRLQHVVVVAAEGRDVELLRVIATNCVDR